MLSLPEINNDRSRLLLHEHRTRELMNESAAKCGSLHLLRYEKNRRNDGKLVLASLVF